MIPPRTCYLPRLRVHALPSGELVTSHREVKRPPIDDGWWREVLHDRRARVPVETYLDKDDPQASYRLDRQKESFRVECPCGRWEWIERDKLIPQVGGGMNVIHLVREWMPCRERNKMANYCRAYVVR